MLIDANHRHRDTMGCGPSLQAMSLMVPRIGGNNFRIFPTQCRRYIVTHACSDKAEFSSFFFFFLTLKQPFCEDEDTRLK